MTSRYTCSWNEDRPQIRALLQQFTGETGTRVKNIPIPEATREHLDLARKLLAGHSGADLLNIDLIWSPTLEPDLLGLKPYLSDELQQLDPGVLTSFTAPATWDELETMAARMQAGERAKGAGVTGGRLRQPVCRARPLRIMGVRSHYKLLSRAYIDGAHSVLTGERKASEVAAELEQTFIETTGFAAGPPK